MGTSSPAFITQWAKCFAHRGRGHLGSVLFIKLKSPIEGKKTDPLWELTLLEGCPHPQEQLTALGLEPGGNEVFLTSKNSLSQPLPHSSPRPWEQKQGLLGTE